MKAVARNVLERVITARGYELKYAEASPRGFERFLAYAKQEGIDPGAVIDVGVGDGTPWLYSAFPDKKLYLFEALASFKPQLDRIAAAYNAEYHICALGETAGELDILVPRGVPSSSSVLKGTDAQNKRLGLQKDAQRVTVKRLDDFELAGAPFLLKLDVEGAELSVLKGATKTLASTVMVICEVGVQPRHQDEPDLADLSAFLKPHGFRLFDFIELSQERLGGRLSYVDVAFLRTTPAGFATKGH